MPRNNANKNVKAIAKKKEDREKPYVKYVTKEDIAAEDIKINIVVYK